VRLAKLVPVAVAAALALAGCGSSDDTTTGSSGASTGASGGDAYGSPSGAKASSASAASGRATVTATEFAFSPTTIDAKAGKLTITLKNAGKFDHELVVLKTDAAPDALKVSGGQVSQAGGLGEIEHTKSGAQNSKTFDLQPGNYVYFCNIPGHYANGMRGRITVR
jgi:plastocyanin